MNLVIVVDDNLVAVNGKPHTVDCSSLVGMHVVNWNGTTGEIEYSLINGVKNPPTKFTDVSPFQPEIDAWTAIDTAPPPPQPSSAGIIVQSYRAGLRRQADALQAQGQSYEAVKLLLKASGL